MVIASKDMSAAGIERNSDGVARTRGVVRVIFHDQHVVVAGGDAVAWSC